MNELENFSTNPIIEATVDMMIRAIDASTDEASFALSGMIVEDYYFNEGLISDYNDCYHLYRGKHSIGFWGDEIDYILNIEEF